ncbi:ZP domain-containing protein [Trichonephila inaurata madagascariensis]|uniref:ZP domain-containing protein n=1 Tax=Trichonephila inaurata madagascariensis TaxID=2747483 RepID=A0A8X7BRK5_9ARAC|nr:ZP domain-containing protein [Trichonephila inaurata madagascariensis]
MMSRFKVKPCWSRRGKYVVNPQPPSRAVHYCKKLLITMLWTQALVAAIAVASMVLGAEEIKEKIDVAFPEDSAPPTEGKDESKVLQERGDIQQTYKPNPQKKSGGAQESVGIPVPAHPPINHLLIPPPGLKRNPGPPPNLPRGKDLPGPIYKTSNQILLQSYEVAPNNHPDQGSYQGGHQEFHQPENRQYQGNSHHDYTNGHNSISYQEGGNQIDIQGYHNSEEGYKPEDQNSLFQGFPSLPHSEPWPLPMPDMPKIIHLDVKCEKNLMKVSIEFDKPFHGIVFSKGHYSHGNCVHLPPGSGHTSVYFDVSINSCGTHGNSPNGQYNSYGGQNVAGSYFENTIVVQYDPQVQEVWDQARRLRCTWHDQYEKAVTFRPFPVDMLNVVRADFAGDNVGCWMQIQVGKGPWASEVSGIVKIGQTMTMVLAIKDEENKFDMMVRNCIAHDGKRAPIELVDSQGCIVRPKLMSRFTKVKNFGSSASVLAFAHFQAFKFPDSMDVHFQCTIQICRPHCPEQCAAANPGIGHQIAPNHDLYSAGSAQASVVRPREERDVSKKTEPETTVEDSVQEMTEIGLNRVIRVVSTGDLAFAEPPPPQQTASNFESYEEKDDVICMSTPGFAASLIVLLSILVISCLVAAFLCLRQKSPRDIITSISGTIIKKK